MIPSSLTHAIASTYTCTSFPSILVFAFILVGAPQKPREVSSCSSQEIPEYDCISPASSSSCYRIQPTSGSSFSVASPTSLCTIPSSNQTQLDVIVSSNTASSLPTSDGNDSKELPRTHSSSRSSSEVVDPYFRKVLDSIYKRFGAPKDSLQLVSEDGAVKVVCHPCSTALKKHAIIAGAKTKALSNLKAHLTRTNHRLAAKQWAARKEMHAPGRQEKSGVSDSQTHKDKVNTQMATVEMEHPGAYRLIYTEGANSSTAKVCCLTCNKLMSLFPEHGSVLNNVRAHIDRKHGAGKEDQTKKQTCLDKFVTVFKEPKLTAGNHS